MARGRLPAIFAILASTVGCSDEFVRPENVVEASADQEGSSSVSSGADQDSSDADPTSDETTGHPSSSASESVSSTQSDSQSEDGTTGDGSSTSDDEEGDDESSDSGDLPTAWTQLASDHVRHCAIDEVGMVWCWGHDVQYVHGGWDRNCYAYPEPVLSEARWQSFAPSHDYSCAIDEDSGLWCWGHNRQGQVGSGETSVSSPPTQIGLERNWVAVDTGFRSSCAVDDEGGLWCWGSGTRLTLGLGDDLDRLEPTRVGDGSDWKSVSVGTAHVCGRRGSGELWCFGRNADGQLGDGSTEEALTPKRIGSESDWRMVRATGWDGPGGGPMTCGIRGAGELWCWGQGSSGQLGQGDQASSAVPVQVLGGPWQHVAVHEQSACAIATDGSLWCWGRTLESPDPSALRLSPERVGNDSNWREVALIERAACGLREDGSAWCWGFSIGSGQLGNGTASADLPASSPVPVGEFGGQEPAEGWVDVALGLSSGCGLQTNGSAWCWGSNGYGELGDGLGLSGVCNRAPDYHPCRRGSPVAVNSARSWSSLYSAGTRNCAIGKDGSLWCWGSGDVGELGVGDTQPRPEPAPVGLERDWTMLSMGRWTSCGLRGSGSLWCWGANDAGQLGIGQRDDDPHPEPIEPVPGSQWLDVAVSSRHICAVRGDGSLWCWGENHSGQLGTGTSAAALEPSQVGADSSWARVFTGYVSSCAQDTRGDLWCWGSNSHGQLGLGRVGDVKAPTRVQGGPWPDVLMLTDATLAVDMRGRLWAWGNRIYAQLGDGAQTPDEYEPTLIDFSEPIVQLAGAPDGHTACARVLDGKIWCWGYGVSGLRGDNLSCLRGRPSPVQRGQLGALTAAVAPGMILD